MNIWKLIVCWRGEGKKNTPQQITNKTKHSSSSRHLKSAIKKEHGLGSGGTSTTPPALLVVRGELKAVQDHLKKANTLKHRIFPPQK